MTPPYQIYGMTPARQNSYLFDEFRFDPATPALFRAGDRVDATPKALEILRVLIENAGEVVSKEDLMKRVWADSFVEEANLSHHIFKLRKALGEQEERKLIETVPKRGYRFVAEVAEESTATETRPKSKRLAWAAGLGGGVLLLTLLTGWYFYAGKANNESSVSSEIRSIAVLPFVNVG